MQTQKTPETLEHLQLQGKRWITFIEVLELVPMLHPTLTSHRTTAVDWTRQASRVSDFINVSHSLVQPHIGSPWIRNRIERDVESCTSSGKIQVAFLWVKTCCRGG